MTKLAKYLKPYRLLIVLCIVLLFVQANADLNLPSYMSNIVNTGIQRSGIEHSSPAAISESGYQLITAFLGEKDAAAVKEAYRAVDSSGADWNSYASSYPDAKGTVYLLSESLSKEQRSSLDAAFGRASYAMMTMMQQMSAQGGKPSAAQNASSGSFDVSELYPMLPMLTAQQPLIEKAVSAAADAPAQTTDATGAVFAKSFLAELGADTAALQSRYIRTTGAMMLLIALLGAAASIGVSLIAARVGAGAARTLRGDIFSRVTRFGSGEFDRFSTASLITRTTNDITQLQMLVIMGLRMVCYAPIMGIGGIFKALSKNPHMSWVLAVGVGIILLFIMVVYRVGMPRFKIMQTLVDKLNLVTRENLSGMMVIRAFGTQKFEEQRFDEANRDLNRTNLFVNRLMAFLMPAMNLVMNLMTLLIIWVGAHQIANSTMQVGDMMAFMQYAMQIMFSFLMISMMFIMIPRAAVSAKRINEVLATEPSVVDPAAPKSLGGRAKGEIAFHDVSFRYAGASADVLQHIDFTAKPGQTTAFIGSTGSGKSTLVNLVPRFYDVTEGRVTLDGVDLRELSLHELRQNIGFVPQKGLLFSGTIASNLRTGDENASEETLKLASEIAQAKEFIDEKPEGLEEPISQGGGNVSGGQKQRLAIARALVKKAPVLVFDDSFSALDFKTDAALRHALRAVTADTTVMIVAQRISTIMNADQIIVLDEGRMVGKGTHKELLENCSAYREIALSQLSQEELA